MWLLTLYFHRICSGPMTHLSPPPSVSPSHPILSYPFHFQTYATKHLYNWLWPLVCLSVTHSLDAPHVATLLAYLALFHSLPIISFPFLSLLFFSSLHLPHRIYPHFSLNSTSFSSSSPHLHSEMKAFASFLLSIDVEAAFNIFELLAINRLKEITIASLDESEVIDSLVVAQ